MQSFIFLGRRLESLKVKVGRRGGASCVPSLIVLFVWREGGMEDRGGRRGSKIDGEKGEKKKEVTCKREHMSRKNEIE